MDYITLHTDQGGQLAGGDRYHRDTDQAADQDIRQRRILRQAFTVGEK